MKSQKIFKLVALLLALVFCLGMLAACNQDTTEPGESSDPTNTSSTNTPLVVAYSPFNGKFSPFFAQTAYDMDVADMTQLGIMTTDRNGLIIWDGIAGETTEYAGKEYTYTGTSKITQTPADDGSTTTYRIQIRDDLKFSDGVAVDIDDVIFYLYAILDPYYDGPSSLSSQNVVGYMPYKFNNANVSNVTTEMVDEAIEDIDNNETLQNYVIENIIKPILQEEVEWVQTCYTNDNYKEYTDAYPEYKDLLYFFYTTERDEEGNPSTDTTEMTLEEILDKLYEEYGYDYVTLGDNYGANFRSQLVDPAYEYILSTMGEGEEVPFVEGIKRIDDYTVEVTIEGYSANAVYQVCGGTIVPMHYYGDESLYDYENAKFGFENREAAGMARLKEGKTDHPVGGGPYKFVKYEDKVVYFEANEHYYKGEPKIKYIQFKESAESDLISGIATGTVDVANPAGSLDTIQEIISFNPDTQDINGEKITTNLVTNLGYGYIGINARLVNVGGVKDSEESIYLRKALATVLAVYREVSYDSYYGQAASVIEYPISTTSWAAPLVGDPGYQVAFAKDVEGNDIYTDTMTADEKYEAAINAAIGFLKAAGYTFDEETGKFTAAPEGAKLEYELVMPGNGVGDHPSNMLIDMSSSALATIGINLIKSDVASATMFSMFDSNAQELWVAAWGSTIDPDMYQVYHSNNVLPSHGGGDNSTKSNHYNIMDSELDDLIMEARSSDDRDFRKTTYKDCLDIVMEWAVEVPAYQRKNMTIFSTERVKIDTITPDMTPYWGWMRDIELLELNV